MVYKIDGKFVSRETYEAYIEQQEADTVSNHNEEQAEATEQTETPERRVYTVPPLTLATRRLNKAQKNLDRARAALEKQQDVSDAYDAAVAEYEAAAEGVRALV